MSLTWKQVRRWLLGHAADVWEVLEGMIVKKGDSVEWTKSPAGNIGIVLSVRDGEARVHWSDVDEPEWRPLSELTVLGVEDVPVSTKES